jgi:ElaB/YqjD/DUF883 family membrane-anchored ribosome-binding protein
MDTTLNQDNIKTTGNGNGLRGARRSRTTTSVSREVDKLISDVERLADRLVDAADPEIARLRSQVEQTLEAVKQSIAEGAGGLRQRATQAVGAADDYVRAQPWPTLGVVALAAAAIGFLAARR